MKATRYVGMINQWDQFIIWTTLEVAVTFPEVDVYRYWIFAGWHSECLIVEKSCH
jgi:hypothetical protein